MFKNVQLKIPKICQESRVLKFKSFKFKIFQMHIVKITEFHNFEELQLEILELRKYM